MAGVFITKGMTLQISNISIPLSGEPSLTLRGSFDVLLLWLGIALKHLDQAKVDHMKTIESWRNDVDPNLKAETIESEAESSMQAMMAAVTAVEAFYANLKERTELKTTQRKNSVKSGAKRAYYVAELFKQSFRLGEKDFFNLRKDLEEIYKYRDAAVHPPAELREFMPHPELDQGVEWRFVWFRYRNALVCVQEVINIIGDLANSNKYRNQKIEQYCKALVPKIAALCESREKYPPPQKLSIV